MTKPENRPPLTLEEVVRMARESTLQHGGHLPLLMVEGDRKTAMLQIAEMAETHEGHAQQLFIAGLLLADSAKIGVLKQVFFITEGWLSVLEDGQRLDRPPSKDPNRLEVVTVSALDVTTGQTQLALLEMKRDDQGALRGLETYSGHTTGPETRAESPLLDAFVLGFLGLSQEAND